MNPRLKPVAVMLGIAALLLVAGLWLMNSYLSAERRKAAQVAKPTVQVETGIVLMTKQDIPAQVEVTGDMVELKEAPLSFIPPDAITNIVDVAGLYAKMPMVQGEILRRVKAVPKEQALSLTYKIPPHMRAITIATTEFKAVGYWVNPGDKVDVIAIFPQQAGQLSGLSQTVLQDVEVLEITPPIPSEDKSRKSAAPTVTLAVTLKQAELLALVDTQAQLLLVLRGVTDRDLQATGGTTFSQIFGQTSFGREDAAPQRSTTIEVFQNGQRISTPVMR